MYLEPSIRAEFALLGETLAVAGRDNAEVRVLDHLGNAGLGCCQVFSEIIKLPSQTEQCMSIMQMYYMYCKAANFCAMIYLCELCKSSARLHKFVMHKFLSRHMLQYIEC